ncbi:hypothetical protein [Shinella daejeonensis]|nr:hypothetical protein [Shinella daejeonensis]
MSDITPLSISELRDKVEGILRTVRAGKPLPEIEVLDRLHAEAGR